MDFIFMLTRDDRTIGSCIEALDSVRSTGLRHVGCKEVGASGNVLKELLKTIRTMKATSYLELVGKTAEECEKGALWAIELGFDRVMGGKDPRMLLELCKGRIDYFPFPGRPVGHPTTLLGSVAAVEEDCRLFASLGCPGIDLLAYRAAEASPEALITAARAVFSGTLVVAGSVESPERIERLGALGADFFTIGSAIFNGRIFPEEPTVEARIRRILETAEKASGARDPV